LQEGAGEKTPVLLLDQLIVPPGVIVPGGRSDTVAVQVVGTPMVIDEPQTIPVVVEMGLTVSGSQLLVTGLLFASPLYVALKLYCPTVVGV
jgi:hypothetical protein